jgi:hypothetical protein
MRADPNRATPCAALGLLLTCVLATPTAAAPFKLQCEVEFFQSSKAKRQPEQVIRFNYTQVIRVDPTAKTIILEKRVNIAQRKAVDEIRILTDVRELNDDRIAVCLDTVGKCAVHTLQVGDQPMTAYAKPTLVDLVNMKFRAFDVGEYRNGNDWGFVSTTGKGDCKRLPPS